MVSIPAQGLSRDCFIVSVYACMCVLVQGTWHRHGRFKLVLEKLWRNGSRRISKHGTALNSSMMLAALSCLFLSISFPSTYSRYRNPRICQSVTSS